MTITSFYPIFCYKDTDAAIKRYEEIGFKVIHKFENGHLKHYVLEVGNDCLDIMYDGNIPVEDGYFGMRVNVRDFEEGMEYFKKCGYNKVLMEPVSGNNSIHVGLTNKKGERILLYYHIRNEG